MGTTIGETCLDRVIYIGGYGRSGSSLLDMVLGNCSGVFGAGELRWLFHFACGLKRGEGIDLQSMYPWREVLQDVAVAVPEVSFSRAAALTDLVERGRANDQEVTDYQVVWRHVFSSIAERSGKPIVVDSSKTCWSSRHRFKSIAQAINAPIDFVHISRNPKAVLWSVRRKLLRTNKRTTTFEVVYRCSRSAAGLMVANYIAASLAGKGIHRRRACVRYECLATSLETAIRQLSADVDTDLSELIERHNSGRGFDPGTPIGGNRFRRDGERVEIRIDEEWKNVAWKTGDFLGAIAGRFDPHRQDDAGNHPVVTKR